MLDVYPGALQWERAAGSELCPINEVMAPCVRDNSWVKVTMVRRKRSGPALARDSVAVMNFRQ